MVVEAPQDWNRVLQALKNFVNDGQIRVQLRLPGLGPPVAGRFGVRQNLLERVPVNVVFGTRGAFTDLFGQHSAANFSPFLHIRKHLGLLLVP